MLPTAVVTIGDESTKRERVRALLDPCSETTLVNIRLVKLFGDKIQRVNVGVAGITGSSIVTANYHTHLYLFGPLPGQRWRVEAYGLRHIGIVIPTTTFDIEAASLDPELPNPGLIQISS